MVLDKSLTTVKFWFHIRGLTYECITQKVGKKLVDSFLYKSEVQIREFIDSREKYIRLKAQILLENLLPQELSILRDMNWCLQVGPLYPTLATPLSKMFLAILICYKPLLLVLITPLSPRSNVLMAFLRFLFQQRLWYNLTFPNELFKLEVPWSKFTMACSRT